MSGEYHRNAIFICHVNGLLISDGSARLDDSRDACLSCGFNGVAKGEECIGAHDGALRFFACFCNRDVSRADAVHLAGTDAKGGVLICEDDRIRLHVLDDDPGKFQCFPFFFRRRSDRKSVV